MRRLLKPSLIVVSFILILLIGLTYLASIGNEKVDAFIQSSLQKHLIPQIDSLETRVTFLHHFPHPCLKINYLSLSSTIDSNRIQVASIEHAHLQFNLFKYLWRGQYEFKDINVPKAQLKFFTNQEGTSTALFRRVENTKKDIRQLPTIKFPNIVLKNTNVQLNNEYKKNQTGLQFDDTRLEGKLENQQLQLQVFMNGVIDSLNRNEHTILSNKPIQFNVDYIFDEVSKKSSFSGGTLRLHESEFTIIGSILSDYPNGQIINFELNGKNDFDALIGLFPQYWQGKFRQANPHSSSQATFLFSGLVNPKKRARVDITTKVEDAILISNDYDVQLDKLGFEATYTNGDLHAPESTVLKLGKLSATLNNRPIFIDFEVKNSKHPKIKTDFDINMDLRDFQRLFPLQAFEELGGILQLKGKYRTPPSDSYFDGISELRGSIVFDNDQIVIKKPHIEVAQLNGQILLKDNQLHLKNIKGLVTDSPIAIEGKVSNLYRLFIENKHPLNFDLNIHSSKVNFNQLVASLADLPRNKKSKSKNPLNFPSFIEGKIQLSAPLLSYKNITAKDFSTNILVKNEQIIIPNLYLDALDGKIMLDARMERGYKDHYILHSNLKVNKINTQKLLTLFNNFGQKVITDDNVKGSLSTEMQLYGEIDQSLKFLPDEFGYDATFSLKNAELIQFEPVMKAFHFLKKASKHVYIDDLEGRATYRHLHLVVPELQFNSNLTSVALHGHRKPNEQMNFLFKINLIDLFFKSNEQKIREVRRGKQKAGGTHVLVKGWPNDLKVRPKGKKYWGSNQKEVAVLYEDRRNRYFK